MKIGFIGQGWIGKNYADNFEERGFAVVRYALEEPYSKNLDSIQECSIVFVAVPTPTTIDGFSCDAVQSAVSSVSPGTIVIIKSTMLPGSTRKLQTEFPSVTIFHSPEFLRERHAQHDAAHPQRNIIGVCNESEATIEKARQVLEVLPEAPYSKIMSAEEAELVKYAGNCFLYQKILFMNTLYDLSKALDTNWDVVREAMVADTRIGDSHTEPVHVSGHVADKEHPQERGAGGHCFIKDYEALRELYLQRIGEDEAYHVLTQSVNYNKKLLRDSGKDLDILGEVYGE